MRRLVILIFTALLSVTLISASIVENRLAKVEQRQEENSRLESLRSSPAFPGLSGKDGIEKKEGFIESNQTETGKWLREGWFYNYSNFLREGVGPDIPHKKPISGKPAEDVIKVLVIGDSMVFGTGLSDRELRWPNQLERTLNERTTPGAFHVETLGRDNASAIEEPEWLTKKRIEALDPDILVISYFMNDPVPSYREEAVCGKIDLCHEGESESLPGYTQCVNGRSGLLPVMIRKVIGPWFPNIAYNLLQRNCDVRKLTSKNGIISPLEIQNRPKDSPYWPLMQTSVRSIPNRIGEIPILFAPLHLNDASYSLVDEVSDLYKSIGAIILPMHETLKIVGEKQKLEVSLRSNPEDGHPGGVVTQAIADDVTDSILVQIDSERLKAATKSALMQSHPLYPLISNMLPITLSTQGDNNEMKVTHESTIESKMKSYQYLGKILPPQHVPCALLNRPHAQIILEPTRMKKVMKVDITSAMKNGLELYIFAHKTNQKPNDLWGPEIMPLGRYKAGDQVKLPSKLPSGASVNGILVAESGSIGCEMNDIIQLDSFSLLISNR